MAIGGGTILSLVLGERSAVLTQVTIDKSSRVLQRVAQFVVPQGSRLLDRPADTGAALAAFLASHGFNAKRAVAGVPARWLIAQERELPPVDVTGANDLLRLAAERLSLAESGALVADYAGVPDAKHPSRVLLVGMLKPQLDRVRQLIEAAGLQLAAVCPTSLAVARVAGGGRNVLRLSDDGAELVLQQNGSPRSLQPLTPDLALLGPELRRTLTMRGAAGDDLIVADAVGLTGPQSADLLGKLNKPAVPFGQGLDVTVDSAARNGQAETLAPDAHWPGVALALAASEKRGLPVDFADTKLAVIPARRFGRRTVFAVLGVLLLVGGFVWLTVTVNAAEKHEAELAAQVAAGEKPTKDAQTVIDQIAYGRTYFDQRPPVLDCLKEITMARNYDEPIYFSQVIFNANGKGTLDGKAYDERNADRLILDLVSRLRTNKDFQNITNPQIVESGGKEKMKSFSINFTFVPLKAAK